MRDDYDEQYYEYVTDSEGNSVRRLKESAPKEKTSSEWTTYDTSHGHCGLCGSISCNYNCIK